MYFVVIFIYSQVSMPTIMVETVKVIVKLSTHERSTKHQTPNQSMLLCCHFEAKITNRMEWNPLEKEISDLNQKECSGVWYWTRAGITWKKTHSARSEKAEGRNWVNGITSSETLECTEHHDQSRASKKGFPSGFIRDSFHERLRLNYKTVTISGSKFRSKHG